MLADLRRALRVLGSRPWETLVVIATVASGLAVNLVLFGVVRGLYVQERSVPAGDRLLWISFVEESSDGAVIQLPPRSFLDRLSAGGPWDAVGGISAEAVPYALGGRARYRSWVAHVTPRFHALEGVRMAAGRFFEDEDTVKGGGSVAIVSHEEATAAFGSATAALGRTVRVGGADHQVVGVLPADYDAGEYAVRVPLGPRVADAGPQRLRTVVRLRPGESRERARAELEAFAQEGEVETPPVAVRVGGEKEVLSTGRAVREATPVLLVAGAVLLIAIANLAAVLLGRGLRRAREIALRRLLGAGRWRLMRPLLLESALVAVLSVAVGILLSAAAFRFLFGSFPTADAPRVGPALLGYGVGLAFVVLILGGCWPAFVSGGVDPAETIRSGAGSVVGPGRRTARAMGMALATEMAVALCLVLATAELASSALERHRRGVGFDPEGLVHVELPAGTLDPGQVASLIGRAEARASVRAAAATAVHPVTDPTRMELDHGGPVALEAAPPPRALRIVTMWGEPLDLLEIPVVSGRDVTRAEVAAAAPVALIGRTGAAALFGAADPIGRRLRVGYGPSKAPGPWMTVVGVVGDVLDQPLFQHEAPPAVWTPAPQPDPSPLVLWARPARGATAEGRRSLANVVTTTTGMESPTFLLTDEWVRTQTREARLEAGLSAVAATMAVLLCLLGLYGLTRLVSLEREPELGVRSALGAGRLRLITLVLRQTLPYVATGAGIGTSAWLVIDRMVLTTDANGSAVVAATALFAGLVVLTAVGPILGAVSTDPSRVLRSA
ncbi:MAG: ABC transporter permease [Gemmatimonadota bacterium]|jgi:predicted permease